MFIALIGCDGSGKSAVIAGVAERLTSNGYLVETGHWRPRIFSGGTNGIRLAIADDPHGQVPRGFATSILKLGWLWFNWWLGWFQGLNKSSSKGVVLYDRYHADILVDPLRYRYSAPIWIARIASRLMPQPDIILFLDADPGVLISRKQEVTREALKSSREKYLALCASHPRFRIIDASQPLEHVIDEVLTIVNEITPHQGMPLV
jgi:thymidylate kinase